MPSWRVHRFGGRRKRPKSRLRKSLCYAQIVTVVKWNKVMNVVSIYSCWAKKNYTLNDIYTKTWITFQSTCGVFVFYIMHTLTPINAAPRRRGNENWRNKPSFWLPKDRLFFLIQKVKDKADKHVSLKVSLKFGIEFKKNLWKLVILKKRSTESKTYCILIVQSFWFLLYFIWVCLSFYHIVMSSAAVTTGQIDPPTVHLDQIFSTGHRNMFCAVCWL